jgi:hypothetical protein
MYVYVRKCFINCFANEIFGLDPAGARAYRVMSKIIGPGIGFKTCRARARYISLILKETLYSKAVKKKGKKSKKKSRSVLPMVHESL